VNKPPDLLDDPDTGDFLTWRDFGPTDALAFLGYLRKLPSKRAAQRLGLTVVAGASAPGTLLSPATVNRVLAAASSFYDWAIATEAYTSDESPFQVRGDQALARVPDRHRPFMGRASRQRPVRRIASVRQPMRLPHPIGDADVEKFLASLTRLRDLAIFLLMLDGGLRPGEGAVFADR
jgi:integrase